MANTKITNPELFNLGANNTAATQLPVMTTTQRTAMTGLSVGEMIFNSTTDKVEYFDGTKWYGITYELAVLTNLSILSVAGGGAGGGLPSAGSIPTFTGNTGSLGLGITVAVGRALANKNRKVHVLISDGESAEGSVWEALRFIKESNLSNIEVYCL